MFVITETLWSSIIFKIIMVSLHSSCAPMFKFSITPSGETTDQIKKVTRMQNGTDLLYHHVKYDGDPGSRAGCWQKSECDFFLCFFVTKFVITETLWSSIIFKIIMVSLHSSCAPMFKFFYPPPEFFPRGKFLPKITIFGRFLGP